MQVSACVVLVGGVSLSYQFTKKKNDMALVIEIPSNANTIFAGRIVGEYNSFSVAELIANDLHQPEMASVKRRQYIQNAIAGTGVAASEIASVEYGVISEEELDGEFERRCNR